MNASAAVGGGVISLSSGLANSIGTVAAGISAFVASYWARDWPWWSYYLTLFPAVLGYSVFLCVGLSEFFFNPCFRSEACLVVNLASPREEFMARCNIVERSNLM